MVIGELNRRDVPVARIDPAADFPVDLTMSARIGGDRMTGALTTRARGLNLAEVRAVYHRRPTPFPLANDDDPPAQRFSAAQARYGLGGTLASLSCLYVNHPWQIAAAEHKPWQLAVAAQEGFTVPPTLITNRVDDARAFAVAHSPIVYKALRDVPVRDNEGRWCTVWVDEVDPREFDDSIGLAPHMFQARVPKVADLRLTVIGRAIFCVRIESPLIDWRADYERIRYSVADVPRGIADAARRMLNRAGLAFGAFDLGLSADGKIWFYELNANGQWAWLEDESGLPLTSAMADLLEGINEA